MKVRRSGMPLVGIVAKKKDIQTIRKQIKEKNIEIIEITKESIRNIKNVRHDQPGASPRNPAAEAARNETRNDLWQNML